MILNSYTDGLWLVAHGAGGHHAVRLFVNITNYGVGNRLYVSVNGDANIGFFEVTGQPSFSFKFPHSNCCGNIGCGYIITAEERLSDGITVVQTITNSPVELCPTDDLISNENPLILDCNINQGINIPVNVQSIPIGANYIINLYLDGDSTYTSLASAVTNGLGIATIIIPNAINGQKYWFSSTGNGKKESFGNSLVIGGNCSNFLLNATSSCVSGQTELIFAPSGGSGDYSYSTNNNDSNGYLPIVPLTLPDGIYSFYIRDNQDYNKKIMFTINCNCSGTTSTSTSSTTTITTSVAPTIINYFSNPINVPNCENNFIPFTFTDVPQNDLIDVSYTMSYYQDIDHWLAYHDYQPQGIFRLRNNKIISFNNNVIYIHNVNDKRGIYYNQNQIKKSIITPVFTSENRLRNKLLSMWTYSITWISDFIIDKLPIRENTFSHISLHDSYQSTGLTRLIPLLNNFTTEYDIANVRRIKHNWQFNKFRDLIFNYNILTFEEWTELEEVVFNQVISEDNINNANINNAKSFERKRRFIDDYIIVKLEHDNINQNQLLLHDIDISTNVVNR